MGTATVPVLAAMWSHLVDVGDAIKPGFIEIRRSANEKTYRVILSPTTRKGSGGMKTRTFTGETAWSDATRYASDVAAACGHSWHPAL